MNYLRSRFGKNGVTVRRLDDGESNLFLGLEWQFDRNAGTCKVHQTTYLRDLLDETRLTNCKPEKSPSVVNGHLPKHDKDEKDPMYARLVGRIAWLRNTRMDIAYANKELGRHLVRNGAPHMEAVRKCLRYLRGKPNEGVMLRKVDPKDMRLRVYVDASYGECLDTRKSTTGIVLTLGTSVIHFQSVTQKTVAISSCEAEFNAMIEGAKVGIRYQSALEDLGIISPQPLELYSDSQSAILLTRRDRPSNPSKHYGVRFFKMKEYIENSSVTLTYEPTDTMIADGLTKQLGPLKAEQFLARVRSGTVMPTFPAELSDDAWLSTTVTRWRDKPEEVYRAAAAALA